MDRGLLSFLLEPLWVPYIAVLIALGAYWIHESRGRAQWSRDEAVHITMKASSAYRDASAAAVYRGTAANPRAPAVVRWTALWGFVALGNIAGVFLFIAIGIPFYAMSPNSADLWLVSAVVAMFPVPPSLLLASWSRRLLCARPSIAHEAGPWLGLIGTLPSLLLGLLLCAAPWPATLLAPFSFVLALSPIPAILGRRKALDRLFELWRERGYVPEVARDDELPIRVPTTRLRSRTSDDRARTAPRTSRGA